MSYFILLLLLPKNSYRNGFDVKKRTVILAHGYNESPSNSPIKQVGEELLKKVI